MTISDKIKAIKSSLEVDPRQVPGVNVKNVLEKKFDLQKKWKTKLSPEFEKMLIELEKDVDNDYAINEELRRRIYPVVYVVPHLNKKYGTTTLNGRCNFLDSNGQVHKLTVHLGRIEDYKNDKDSPEARKDAERLVRAKIDKMFPM